MLLLFNLYPAAALAVRRGQDQLAADNLAQTILDEKRALAFEDLQLGQEAWAPVTENGRSYTSLVEVFDVDGHPDVLKGVRVIVSWPGLTGMQTAVHEMYLVNLER
jgi:hypothetical protein